MPIEAKPLFRPDVLLSYLAKFTLPEKVEQVRPKLKHWANLLTSAKADKLKEKELLPDFLTDFFYELLGYTGPAGGQPTYTISREKHVEVDGKFADAVLGKLGAGQPHYVVALEGKGPKDPLDRPFAGRRLSAVQQGYEYAINLPCDWIIVTSMRQTRLYHKSSTQANYEVFDTAQLAADEAQLKKFVFLLSALRVVPVAGPCHFADLLTRSERKGQELTRAFYQRYADMRQQAFEHLRRENPSVPPTDLLRCTQLLLDRVLFCAFCEDRELLPRDSIRKAYEHADPYHPRPTWDNFRGLFRAINLGSDPLKIPAYNGGLFGEDVLLDSLRVPDEVCGYFRELGDYAYRPGHQVKPGQEADGQLIDVDILGHIFEQSITDLEKLHNELTGKVAPEGIEKHRTRRKKEGAFYTPEFITRYIVEQALGKVLDERFEKLRAAQLQAAKGSARKVLADPRVYDLDRLTRLEQAALAKFWHAWQDELRTVRLLDPACGSGAFLIQAFDYLHHRYQSANDRLAELEAGYRTLFDLDREILQKNLYGVDINDEAIEICRLGLWIKTAQWGKQLVSLDHNIQVGNSVVRDQAVDARAFDWQSKFPEVFAAGGFDVVVANPPYIRQEWLAPFKPHWEKTFESYHGVADIFILFYELGVRLLRDQGRLSFITSGSWVRSNAGGPLRAFLPKNVAIESMIDFGEFQPFEEAEMIRPTICVMKKQKQRGAMHVFKWLTTGRPPENLSEVIEKAPTMQTDHLGTEAWEIETDAVRTLRQKLTDGGHALREYPGGRILRGILTGLTEVFIINDALRSDLVAQDARSLELIKPFAQGTHLRPWYMETSGEFLIAIRSSANYSWPWSDSADQAEAVFERTYPAIHAYLSKFKDRAIQRQDKGRFWWELRACAYWGEFDRPKIVWPDISKLPRFSMDSHARYLGNTAYTVPGEDYFLLGVLSSWATWFIISKTAQPLRLRGDRWQYRLFSQFMENVPIPDAKEADRKRIADLAARCTALGQERYELQTKVQRRLAKTFAEDSSGRPTGVLNTKAQSWWELSLNELGDALKASFDLPGNPLKNPRTADEWEPYLIEKRAEAKKFTQQLADAETESNDRVYRLFHLTPDEIKLLQKEVEH